MLRIRLLTSFLAVAAVSALTACEDAPDYPDTPSIQFKSITAERVTPTTGETPYNRIYVTVAYKDGDGDLGLSEEDIQSPPFNSGRYSQNYFITMFRQNSSGVFEQYVPFIPFNGRFPRMLEPNEKSQPIRGDLTYEIYKGIGFSITDPNFRPGTKIKFNIQIVDRALHESNVITTDELTLP
ncbi:hypothetical protein [Solirubrum puertoriconensis]|uniref:Uncharacterized protein n=1 Tax=Solirubrum puertoriconensis TaxID=1751427 RepID=A0A9X0HJX9_SOLP1|nr:hypothetical protein [Solirubrum puertoriconensis]KUG07305.1 hypothetical protein ASU33_13165 [Solirubrum puertoriconensis]